MNRLNSHEKGGHSCNELGSVEGPKHKNVVDQGLAHESPYQVEEARYINGNKSYNFKPNNNLPTHYMKTCPMEVECSKVQDQLRIFKTMLHLSSKGKIKEFRELKIKDRGDLSPLKRKC